MNAHIRTASVLIVLAALAGCRTTATCKAPDYNGGETVAALKVPEGLDAPDTRNALKIPQVEAAPRPAGNVGPCRLAEPPEYKPGALLDGTVDKKSKHPKQPEKEKSG